MADWRHQFGGQLAFLVVQLPNYGPQPVAPGESRMGTACAKRERQAVAHDPRGGTGRHHRCGRRAQPAPRQQTGGGQTPGTGCASCDLWRSPCAPSGSCAVPASRAAPIRCVVDFGDIETRSASRTATTPRSALSCARTRPAAAAMSKRPSRIAQVRLSGAGRHDLLNSGALLLGRQPGVHAV